MFLIIINWLSPEYSQIIIILQNRVKSRLKKKNNGLYYSTNVLSGGFFYLECICIRSVSVGVCFGGTLSESRGQGIGIRGPGPDRQLVQQEPGRIGQGHP